MGKSSTGIGQLEEDRVMAESKLQFPEGLARNGSVGDVLNICSTPDASQFQHDTLLRRGALFQPQQKSMLN
jgi:hypothetical protein